MVGFIDGILFLIVISGSRTSVLSALISVVVGVIFLVVSLIKAKKSSPLL